jgi:hypothetical protein
LRCSSSFEQLYVEFVRQLPEYLTHLCEIQLGAAAALFLVSVEQHCVSCVVILVYFCWFGM